MWLLNFLPGWFFALLIFAGILGYVASIFLTFIPTVSLYRTPIRIVSTLVIILGVWFTGVAAGTKSNEEKWQARVKEAEEKVVKAEAEAATATEKLRQETDKKTAARDEKTKTVVRYLDSWITKEITKTVEGPERIRVEKIIEYIERCPVPKELLDAHNAGARGEEMKK